MNARTDEALAVPSKPADCSLSSRVTTLELATLERPLPPANRSAKAFTAEPDTDIARDCSILASHVHALLSIEGNMSVFPILEVTAVIHRGALRGDNQDCITVAGWVSDVEMSAPRRSRHILSEPLLIAVSDGMGGGPAGDIAARYAIKRLAMASFSTLDDILGALDAVDTELGHAMAAAPELAGMGTTVVGLLLTAEQALWFNIGDSRLYRLRDNRLMQLSVDDVPEGSPAGVITQALGGPLAFARLVPHHGTETMVVPSRWLLCSDGLTQMVSDDDIERAMEAGDEDAARMLFAKAMEAGGADNISIVVVSVVETHEIK
jgi:PPM family protein phosphatase